MNICIKEFLRKCLRLTWIYKKEYNRLQTNFDLSYLNNAIIKMINDVPYYSKYRNIVTSVDELDLSLFPILRKKDIMSCEELLLSNKVNKKFLFPKKTGGTSGISLKLYNSWDVLVKMNCSADIAFNKIGKNLKVAILRGSVIENDKVYKNLGLGTILLSSYHLTEENLDTYLAALKKYEINCLHVFPSSIVILARLIKNKYGVVDLPKLKGILASSEIFSKEDKILVKEVFPNVKIIDYYGMSEFCCCAVAEDLGYYQFNNNFGYVEFVDTGERINGTNRVAEIVATSIMNATMPLLRYGTEDYVELDENNNVVSIIGRTSDFLVNRNKQLSPCIVVLRDQSKINMNNFQYYQCKEGELIFRIVVNDKFSEQEKIWMTEDLNNSFNGLIDCSVEVVDNIERTKAGKQKRLVQMLDLNHYKNLL